MADTSSDGTGSYAPANWVALSDDATPADQGDTVMAGELTGGTLDRAQASYAHTNGTATYTLINTFTSDRDATVYKYGVFTAASGGTLAFEEDFDSAVPLKIGDTVQVVDTISL
jgi:hypothetical protein